LAKNLNLLLKHLLLSIRIRSRISSKKETKPYSQQIAEELFDIPIRKEGNVPSSKEELLKLSYIKDALKILTRERKVIGFLIEDPITK
jgi:hypothetical protein